MPSPRASKTKGAQYEGQMRDLLTGLLPARTTENAAIAIELKAEKAYNIPGYVREAKKEMANAGAEHWVVIMRKRGSTDLSESFVVLDLDEWIKQCKPAASQIDRIRLSGAQDRGDLSGVYLP